MTRREVLIAALKNQETPRPAWVPFVGVHGGKLIGMSSTDYLQSSGAILEGLTRAYELYRPDGLPIIFDLQLEAEVLGCDLHWSVETPPSVTSHPLISGSLADLPPFDLKKGRFPIAFEALREAKKKFGDQIALYGLITGPFTLTSHLRGTDMFLDMFTNPDQVMEIMNFSTDIACQVAAEYLANGAEVIAVVDPMTSQIRSAHFEQFVTPFLNRIYDFVRSQGGYSSLFVCGDATRNLEVMCKTTCDNISIDENIPLDYVKELAQKYGKSFGGNLRLTSVLLLGTEDMSRLDAIRCIDLGGNKGFVLAPGCDLPYATPPQNLEAVVEMVFDPYAREVARNTIQLAEQDTFDDISLPSYDLLNSVVVDVITLDSNACAPCQYMMDAVKSAVERVKGPVEVYERKIKTREGLGIMCHLKVEHIPSICIDGELKFSSVIPDQETLAKSIQEVVDRKKGK